MTPVLEGALLAGVLMAGSFLLALALSESRTRMMSTLLEQERRMREKAEAESQMAKRVADLASESAKSREVLELLDVTVGKMTAAMQMAGHFTRRQEESEPIGTGAISMRFSGREAQEQARLSERRLRETSPTGAAEPI